MPAEHLGQIERRPQIRARLKGCACVHVGFDWHTRTMSPRGKASTRPPTSARSPRQRCQRDRWSASTTRSGSRNPWCTARAPWCEQLGRSSPQGKSRRTRRSFATQRRPTRPCQRRNRTDNPFPSVPEGALKRCAQEVPACSPSRTVEQTSAFGTAHHRRRHSGCSLARTGWRSACSQGPLPACQQPPWQDKALGTPGTSCQQPNDRAVPAAGRRLRSHR